MVVNLDWNLVVSFNRNRWSIYAGIRWSISPFFPIIGYFTIPTVTSWVIQAGGAGNFMRNVTKTAETAGNIASAGAGSVTGNISGQLLK